MIECFNASKVSAVYGAMRFQEFDQACENLKLLIANDVISESGLVWLAAILDTVIVDSINKSKRLQHGAYD